MNNYLTIGQPESDRVNNKHFIVIGSTTDKVARTNTMQDLAIGSVGSLNTTIIKDS